MIITLNNYGWEVIYHRAHALLAAQIAGFWQESPDTPHRRLVETVAAISHHDDLEKEWEGNHLTPAGAPLDFLLENSTPIAQLQALVDSAVYRSRWVALLTSMHVSFLNESKRGHSSEIDEFLEKQQHLQTQWREELEVSQAEAASAYRFMNWCDRLSLILCQHQLPDGERALEITTGPDGRRYDVVQWQNGEVSVSPWCFRRDRFTVNVEACYLNQMTFNSNEELTQALQNAARQGIEWTFVKPDRDLRSVVKE